VADEQHGRPSVSDRRGLERVGDLMPEAARRLGLESELRLARAVTTWAAIVGERLAAAADSCRLVRVDGLTLVVEADDPAVAQELRLRSPELVRAFAAAPGGVPATDLRVIIRRV
jgi:predicted nucleic acid-binding Zn ribbon protein